jgi:oxygen-dependent protoporphyrinogen oxidase
VAGDKTRIVIIGGGIAGLSIAWAIRKRHPAVDLVLLERGAQTGGNIRTECIDGFVCESGPDGFMDSAPATMALVREIGLESRLLPSNDSARRRYLFSNGRLSAVPTSPGTFLTTPLLSTHGKLRVLCEPIASASSEEDESILAFATRRIGNEAATQFVDPMVSGVFGGDPEQLSLRACFPKLWQLERDHGGLVRGWIATRRTRRSSGTPVGPAGRLTSFVAGMSELTDALTRSLGSVVQTSSPVLTLVSQGSTRTAMLPRRFAVTTPLETFHADAVVLAGSAFESARILRDHDPVLSSLLTPIRTAPMVVACLGYDDATIRSQCRLDGFGFLVPRHQGVRILGALWETSIYEHRAPVGKTLIRVMMGGARDTDAISLSDDALLQRVRTDLARTMNLSAAPEMTRVIRHHLGIPQYERGHLTQLAQIAQRLARHPGLLVAGNSYRGVSINSCVAEADSIAESVVRAAESAAPDAVRHEAAGTLSS